MIKQREELQRKHEEDMERQRQEVARHAEEVARHKAELAKHNEVGSNREPARHTPIPFVCSAGAPKMRRDYLKFWK